MTTGSGPVARPPAPTADPLALAADVPLSADEAGYVVAAPAANKLRGYGSDWAEVHRLVRPAR
jgi:hypothetical protein